MKDKRIACFVLVLHMGLLGFAETFRVHKTVMLPITEKNQAARVQLDVNDVLVLTLPEKSLFLQGVELEIKIPPIAAEFPDAIAYALYTDIEPEPSADIIDYSGKRMHIDTFPGRLGCNIKIPLIKEHTIRQNPYTIILPAFFTKPVKTVFFRLQLVMKGVPQELINSVFSIEVKPVLTNQGLLDLQIKYPPELKDKDKKEFLVFIDEEPLDLGRSPMLLTTGMHRLNIVSEHYRNEVRSFMIEQAKTSVLEVQLQDIVPLLYLSAPKNTRFFMDNTEIKDYSKPLVVEPGTHQLRFSLGDYEAVRVLQAENGRTYRVSVSFDVSVSEE
ncbi:hypothetical protein V1L52_05495 [Treponema sp. HNW]|uniref:hypothetical protein n=1 Tax=Treponema sp. HNW TaxID=3116654 RepID=UPI003D0A8363